MKTIIFDFDGTLANTFPVTMDILNRIGKYYALPKVNESEYDEYRKIGVRGLMEKFNMPKLKLIVFAIHIKYIMKKELNNIKLFKGVKELLESLNNRVLIFSSNNQKNISKIFENNGIKNIPKVYTEISLINKSVGLKKLLKSENLSNNDVLYIGDEVRDYEGAKGANIEFIGVSWGYNSEEGLKNIGVSRIVNDFNELKNKIVKLG